jgi:hypothetical protein
MSIGFSIRTIRCWWRWAPSKLTPSCRGKHKFVSAECWLVRNEMMRLTFGTETNMHRLLQVKGSTGGLVSVKLQGRNLHLWLAPLPIAERLRDSVAIARDRTITISGSRAQVGMFALAHAVNTHERFSRFAADPNLSQSGLWTPRPSVNQSVMGLWTPRQPSNYSDMGLCRPPPPLVVLKVATRAGLGSGQAAPAA